MSSIEFLLDENITPALRKALHRKSPDMVLWCVGDIGILPKGIPDAEILVWCEQNGTILVTNNRASMPVHLHDHSSGRRGLPLHSSSLRR